MEFYKYRQVKSCRKNHLCVYCDRKIKKGESAIYAAGRIEGDTQMYSYYLCPRCEYVSQQVDDGGNGIYYLSNLIDAINDCMEPLCPVCGQPGKVQDFNDDVSAASMECRCGFLWDFPVDLEHCKEWLK